LAINILIKSTQLVVGRDSSVGIATRYELEGLGIESQWGARFSAHVQTDPGAHPVFCTIGSESLSKGQSGRGVALTTPTNQSAEVEERLEL
jgi:hypothetical protein